MLENVRAEFSASTAGQAGRITVHNLQIDNQLLTTAQPVVLARAFRVRLKPLFQHAKCTSSDSGTRHACNAAMCFSKGIPQILGALAAAWSGILQARALAHACHI